MTLVEEIMAAVCDELTEMGWSGGGQSPYSVKTDASGAFQAVHGSQAYIEDVELACSRATSRVALVEVLRREVERFDAIHGGEGSAPDGAVAGVVYHPNRLPLEPDKIEPSACVRYFVADPEVQKT